ncbi:DUF1846 domain-containing protein [Bittarella massiliensis (ex Durand et al. 2017)]|uniref:DUF1846 domain-containing protein n=1 Tax=Bittarella massiliensis (ex Durand et al. 2017) TaxID=1720313 RepID=UPI001AA1C098|nr:DUF1846 domain-containing protein [Bittarella massiliensis (ex Durand et al. 2017)]MBO1678659.1 DUF1846 domain-containing protein [Bittarella massiliensis (ex Durand et al. 2017)]
MKQGFDHEKYLREQSEFILERVNSCEKLYLEFGGKLMEDMHAKRVLPGYDPNAKLKLLEKMKDQVEVVICVYAGDIERNKVRADFNITYDMEVFRLIDDLRSYQLDINSVVITRYEQQPAATQFMNKLNRRGIKTYIHRATKGYPTDVDTIVSDEGYGANPYIETQKPIVVVTGPGPGSGKLATCLSQLYHDYRRGQPASYSKFETFPVWNVPLKHPLNVAYEAATVDLKDVNMIDSFHYDAYGVLAVNYNRDMEMFPVISRIIEKITGSQLYRSPTDMGVNRVGFGITNDEVVKEASRQEIIRRYFKTACEYKKGTLDQETFHRMDAIMKAANLKPEDRTVVVGARKYGALKNDGLPEGESCSVAAIELADGKIITGKSSEMMSGSAAAVLNAIKYLAHLADEIHLLSPMILQPIINLKRGTLHSRRTTLSCEEILMALSVCAATNPVAQAALDKLSLLRGCQAHTTAILSQSDEQVYKKLGMDVTSDPEFPSENLYYM